MEDVVREEAVSRGIARCDLERVVSVWGKEFYAMEAPAPADGAEFDVDAGQAKHQGTQGFCGEV